MADSAATARRYVSRGWAVVPLPPRQKAPRIRSWQKRMFTADDFTDGANIGVKLGEPSGGLVDVDLDDPSAIELAQEFLPATGAIFGPTSKPASHRRLGSRMEQA